MAQRDETHKALYQNKPWANNSNNIWLASTVNLSRNIEKFLFPTKLDHDRKNQIITLLSQPLLKSKELKNPTLIRAEDIGPNEKEYLVEHFLSGQSFHHSAKGEGFILDNSGKFLATLNINNHIQFELIDCQGEIESAWNRMVNIETEIGQSIRYSFSPRYGFLTTKPAVCGTGFVLKIFLQPSALIHTDTLESTLKKIQTPQIKITGLQGNPDEIIGDILVIRNNYCLDVTEEDIISTVRLFTTKLMVEENSLRKKLKKEDSPEVKDKVSRAYGLLTHSYQAEAIESLNAISLLKLGADLDWLGGVTPKELNKLFFDCRRAHLLTKFDMDIPQDKLLHKRAEFIHETLKKAELKI